MPIRISCPTCARTYNVADDLHGKKLRCRECGEAIIVSNGQAEGLVEAVEAVEQELEAVERADEPVEAVEPVNDEVIEAVEPAEERGDRIQDRKGRAAPATTERKRFRDDRYEDDRGARAPKKRRDEDDEDEDEDEES